MLTAALSTDTRISPRARRVLAAIVAVHGLAHGAGVAVNLAIVRTGGEAELLGGWWVTGNAMVLTVAAALWGVLAAMMLMASTLLVVAARAARGVLIVAVPASLVLCLVSLMAAEVGVAVNLGLLAAVAAMGPGSRTGD